MNLPVGIATLQHTDRWVGVPLCAILTLARRIIEPRPSGARLPRKILFVKFAEQGSTVLAYPAIRRAVELVGRENVYFVVFEDNRFILDVMEIIPEENVLTISTRNSFALARGALHAIWRARRLGIDAAVDMEFFTRFSAMFTFLTGARSRVGFHTFFGEGPYRGDLMTHRLLYNSHLHTSQMFAVMVEALTRDPALLPTFDFSPPPEQTFASFRIRPNEAAEITQLLERARKLLARFPDLFIGFTGAPVEAEAINGLAHEVNSSRVLALAGKTTLRQLLALYARGGILVTNDSGPAHFASMTPIHVVTLFGPETPALFAARSPNASVLWAGVACSPCVNACNNRQAVCRDNLCMQAITVEQVFEKVAGIYEERFLARPKASNPSAGDALRR